MKPLSIEQAYRWTQGVVAREWRLILPVAFMFMAFPPLVLDLLAPQWMDAVMKAALQPQNPAPMAQLMSWLLPIMLLLFTLSNVGGLAITALALVPGISVREALLLAFRRLPTLIGAQLLVLLGAILLMIVLSVITGVAQLLSPGIGALVGGMALGFALLIGIRLLLLTATIISRPVGPVGALRTSWAMTGRTFWPLVGAVAVYLIGVLVVTAAILGVLGAAFAGLGQMTGAPDVATALNAVLGRAVGCLVGVGLSLLAAGIYRQLDGSIKGM
ncbi:hypothetical protein [Sphingomonas sp.]|uniref:hypothetical protein n=1 Tax=Sphingomonas sp. TaxID=28214 RepID=UPI003B3B8EBC